ncbi:MAG TPA: hypothetical protein VIK97_09035, partial [Casimicrobiaceae bacterium]
PPIAWATNRETKMTRGAIRLIPMVGALALVAPAAHADQTISFWLNGDGNVSAHGTLTIAANPNANPNWGTQLPRAFCRHSESEWD